MSEQEFDLYLSLLGRFMKLKPGQRAEIADELRDHLEARFEELSASGLDRTTAIHRALEEFGDANDLATHFTQLAKLRRRKLIMRCTVGTVAALAAVMLLGNAFWPELPQGNVPQRAVAQGPEQPEYVGPENHAPHAERGPVNAPPRIVTAHDQDARYAETMQKLAQEVEVNFTEQPFQEALNFLGSSHGIQFLVDQQSLQEIGVEVETTPVTLELNHVKLSTALQAVLERVAGRGVLDYRIWDGIVSIESKDSVSNQMEVRVYDCRDLISASAATRQQPVSYDREGKPRAVKPTPSDQLVDTILGATSGEWQKVNGDGGTINEFDGLLIVRHNQSVHREIEELLGMLRLAMTRRGPAPSMGRFEGPVPEYKGFIPERHVGPEPHVSDAFQPKDESAPSFNRESTFEPTPDKLENAPAPRVEPAKPETFDENSEKKAEPAPVNET